MPDQRTFEFQVGIHPTFPLIARVKIIGNHPLGKVRTFWMCPTNTTAQSKAIAHVESRRNSLLAFAATCRSDELLIYACTGSMTTSFGLKFVRYLSD